MANAQMANLKFEKKDDTTFLIGQNATRELVPAKRVSIDGSEMFFKSVQIENTPADEVLRKIADRADVYLDLVDSISPTIQNFRLDNTTSDEALCAVAVSVGLRCTPRIEVLPDGEKVFQRYEVRRVDSEVLQLRLKARTQTFVSSPTPVKLIPPFLRFDAPPLQPLKPEERDSMSILPPRDFQYSNLKRDPKTESKSDGSKAVKETSQK